MDRLVLERKRQRETERDREQQPNLIFSATYSIPLF